MLGNGGPATAHTLPGVGVEENFVAQLARPSAFLSVFEVGEVEVR
jgi:hypothetical protein